MLVATKKKEKNKGGRPQTVNIDFDLLDDLCGIMCTLNEIAGIFHCSPDTIERRVKKERGMTFKDYWEMNSAPGKVSVRRSQFALAQAGNATMLIWLGKQYLGQSDKTELAVDQDLIREEIQILHSQDQSSMRQQVAKYLN